jgi:hypothetical protein
MAIAWRGCCGSELNVTLLGTLTAADARHKDQQSQRENDGTRSIWAPPKAWGTACQSSSSELIRSADPYLDTKFAHVMYIGLAQLGSTKKTKSPIVTIQ